MIETSEPSTSRGPEHSIISNNVENSDIEMDDVENSEDISSLWCIEDDTLFYAQCLMHHSAGKGKSVYVTWNENYLLNFVFKTSNKTGATTLTKVRISIPIHDQEVEEISNMLILEMNTLVYMKSGRVYYFSSVKSMHNIDWLTGIRCMSSCPHTQFSVIRLVKNSNHDHERILSLEVYKDVPHLGKCLSGNVLKHIYDISFDLENVFNCDWIDETYTLTSLITDERNIGLIKLLVSVGDVIRSQEEVIDLNMNQEIHIFTISGNIFILVGAVDMESKSTINSQVQNFNIRLLNTYACPIECIRIDCENNLLMVLLQSGHMDVWYESKRMFGALLHCQHEITNFLCYDFCPAQNVFYFTTPEEIIQLKIIKTKSTDGVEKECTVRETRKNVGGMIACTFVEGLQQLICLSINNIFYRINFATMPKTREITNENETEYENLNHLYALNENRLKDLSAKARLIDELMEQPKKLHHAIEKEFRKQQVLGLESKNLILKKLIHCHLEYHNHLPGIEYFDKDCVLIKATTDQSNQLTAQNICCLMYMSLENNNNNLLSSVFAATIWYLHISNEKESLQLHIPYEVVNKKLCFVIDIPVGDNVMQILPKLSINLITFFNHHSHSICLKYNIDLATNEKSYINLFSNIQSLQIFRNPFDDLTSLLRKQSKIAENSVTKCDDSIYTLKHRYKITKNAFQYVVKTVFVKTSCSLGMPFKIYYLQKYIIELNYDDSNDTLSICSNYPMAMFYMKLLLIHAVKSYNDIEIVDTSVDNISQIIMNHQCEIEHLYGSLMSSSLDDVNCNTISMHLENLQKIYLKLRIEFFGILR